MELNVKHFILFIYFFYHFITCYTLLKGKQESSFLA